MKDQFIDSTVKIGSETTLGHFVVIEKNVEIGRSCTIGSHVVIHEGTLIGDNVRIDDNTVIGKQPMRAKRSIFKTEIVPPAKIGNNCLIGAQVVIYAGCEVADFVLVADTAALRENVTIGESTIIGRGATVENVCKVGKKCKLETGSYITAYSEIGDYCFIAPKVTTTNDNYLGRSEERFKHFKGVTVKNGGRIGGGAVILPGRVIGEDAVVGAGSVVTRDVPPGQIFVGVPAKYFGDVPEDQLLKNQGWE